MNFWLKPANDRPASMAGGVASGTEILGAAIESMRLVDNSTAALDALTEGYEEWRRRFKAGTGQDAPPNPMLTGVAQDVPASIGIIPNPFASLSAMQGKGQGVETARAEFTRFINEQAARFPAEAVRDWAQFDPGQYAEQLARDADENLALLMESRPGWDKYIASFAGAAIGSLRDPVTVGSLAFGGGPGGARTVIGRILTTAATEAAVNAGTEAFMQPDVQDWRARVGLDSGLDDALKNIAFAGALGGIFGAGGRGLVEVLERQPSAAAARAAMPAEMRGALDAADSLQAMSAQKPPSVSAPIFEQLVARADAALQNPDAPPLTPVIDELQVARIVDALAPDGEGRALPDMAATLELIRTGDAPGAPTSRPVLKFLAQLGGVDPASDIGAELRAAGITSQAMPGIFSRNGLKAIDNIPLEEARSAFPGRTDLDDGNGYVRPQAFIDAATAEIQRQGESVGAAQAARMHFERRGVDLNGDDEAIRARMAEIDDIDRRYFEAGENTRIETTDLVHRALELAGGPVDDAIIRAAVDMHRMEGEDLATAVEWAMSDAAGVSRSTPDLPGHIGTAAESRSLDDPTIFDAEDTDWEAELEALLEIDPTFARQVEDLYSKPISEQAELAGVVEHCPF